MATTVSGYDCEFVESPPDDLKCLICLCVARDALQHGEEGCGKIYCRHCIKQYRKTSNKCPNCRRTITTFKDVRSNRDIQSLMVKCENKHDGCQWVGELRSLEEHLQGCDFQKLPCPNKCTRLVRKRPITCSGTEAVEIYRKDIQNHLKSECPHRQYTCPHCKRRGEYQSITGEHLRVCPKVEVECPVTPICKKRIYREDIKAHLSTCPYQKVLCKYREFGCKVTPYRKDLEDHENDNKAHLKITMETVLTMKKQMAKQKQMIGKLVNNQFAQIQSIESQHPKKKMGYIRTSFRLSEFIEKKEESDEFNSPSFYTHPQGYKMQICIDANGYDEYEGTHVSVWVYLMRGEYDDQLEFPFKGTITFELLNQLEDKNHHYRSYTHDGSVKASKRVVDTERAKVAYGVQDFIPHTGLGLNAAKNCQYLKDDCLVFRIYADVPSYKPWLQ